MHQFIEKIGSLGILLCLPPDSSFNFVSWEGELWSNYQFRNNFHCYFTFLCGSECCTDCPSFGTVFLHRFVQQICLEALESVFLQSRGQGCLVHLEIVSSSRERSKIDPLSVHYKENSGFLSSGFHSGKAIHICRSPSRLSVSPHGLRGKKNPGKYDVAHAVSCPVSSAVFCLAQEAAIFSSILETMAG